MFKSKIFSRASYTSIHSKTLSKKFSIANVQCHIYVMALILAKPKHEIAIIELIHKMYPKFLQIKKNLGKIMSAR